MGTVEVRQTRKDIRQMTIIVAMFDLFVLLIRELPQQQTRE